LKISDKISAWVFRENKNIKSKVLIRLFSAKPPASAIFYFFTINPRFPILLAMVSAKQILMDRDKEYPLTPELEANLDRLLVAVNALEKLYGKKLRVSSGYRPGHYNKAAGGAKASAHLTCEAVDFRDTDCQFRDWLLANTWVLERCGLYLEDPANTLGWIHLQVRPTRSGKRVFIP
jgi:hypothetical protein